MKKKLAILGAGNLGRTLGTRFAAAGIEVRLGARNPDSPKLRVLRDAGLPNLRLFSLEESVLQASGVLFAIPGEAMESVATGLAPHLEGKLLIDATCHWQQAPIHSLDLLHRLLPSSPLFRSFHYPSAEVYEQPCFGDLRADLFYCGQGPDSAQEEMKGLIRAIGMRPVRVGDLEQADLLDSLARLWLALAVGGHRGSRLGFSLLQ